jgi:hypothetical protein
MLAARELLEPFRPLVRRNDGEEGRSAMFRAMFSWMGRLFAPRGDNFKAQLMADLGLKR